MRTETVSYLKAKAADLPVDQVLQITQNGKPKYVVQSVEDYDKTQQALALLKLVNFAEKDIARGDVYTSEQFSQMLQNKKKELLGSE